MKTRTVFRDLLTLAMAALLCVTAAGTTSGGRGKEGATKGQSQNKLYIVQMIEDPVVASKGDIGKLRATAPAQGQKIDPNSRRSWSST